MKIKSYYSRSVESAMAEAREELGSEAMLVESRKATSETRHLGEYEVVFALTSDEPAAPVKTAKPAQPAVNANAANPGAAQDAAGLQEQLEAMHRAIGRATVAPPQWLGGAPDLSAAYAVLAASEVPSQLAREIVDAAESRAASGARSPASLRRGIDPATRERALIEELESRFTVKPGLGKTPAGTRLTALIGPPGAGKTTTIAKLAVNYGLARRRSVLLISMDNHRIAGAEQLRSFAAICEVAFQPLESVTSLAQCIEQNSGTDLILIDTPGLGNAELGDASGLARFLAARNDIDTQLTLAASIKPPDLTRMVDAYQIFRPNRLLFTKLDETASFGSIFHEAARNSLPLSFFGTGQRIPEDIEEASSFRLIGLILGAERAGVRSAA